MLSLAIEAIAALICAVLLYLRPAFLNKWFCIFLWLTVLVEIAGAVMMMRKMPNATLFNLFNPVEIVFYLFILMQPVEKKYKRLLVILGCLYVTIAIVNLFFIQGLVLYNNNTVLIGSVAAVIACLLVLLTWITNYGKDNSNIIPYVLIATGILIFYTGTFAYNQLINYLVQTHMDTDRHLFNLIFQSLNPVLYCAFIAALYIEYRRQSLIR